MDTRADLPTEARDASRNIPLLQGPRLPHEIRRHLEKVRTKFYSIAAAYRVVEPDDFYQDYCVWILEGGSPTRNIQYFIIDRLRQVLGRTGARRMEISELNLEHELKISDESGYFSILANELYDSIETPTQRAVFSLHFIHGENAEYIAEVLNTSKASVWVMMMKLRRRLKKRLKL